MAAEHVGRAGLEAKLKELGIETSTIEHEEVVYGDISNDGETSKSGFSVKSIHSLIQRGRPVLMMVLLLNWKRKEKERIRRDERLGRGIEVNI